MVKPTNEWLGRAYPPRERWVIDAVAFARVPIIRSIDEVGMQ
jgi:hypothetical protein